MSYVSALCPLFGKSAQECYSQYLPTNIQYLSGHVWTMCSFVVLKNALCMAWQELLPSHLRAVSNRTERRALKKSVKTWLTGRDPNTAAAADGGSTEIDEDTLKVGTFPRRPSCFLCKRSYVARVPAESSHCETSHCCAHVVLCAKPRVLYCELLSCFIRTHHHSVSAVSLMPSFRYHWQDVHSG